MRTIREGVFETNSSSTHSVSIKHRENDSYKCQVENLKSYV